MKSHVKTLVWISLFAIAMGFMESTVVIYLREIYYKTGFGFPLRPVSPFIGKVEFCRELGTIIMLVAAGIISGKTRLQRFAYFVLAFAIWDIFYYLFLYIALGWPQSLATWDILFLVPVPWVGPVWAPCLLSVLMIVGAVHVIIRTGKDPYHSISPICWWLLISGALICIFSFMWDYLIYTAAKGNTWSLASESEMFAEISSYVPASFNYILFLTGFISMCLPVTLSILKPYKK